MSDRADFLAGIAASGYGADFGIYGDFGTFSGPYPDPSPPRGVYEISDHDMSDDFHPSSGQGHSDNYAPTLKTRRKRKLGKKAKAARREAKAALREKKKADRRAERISRSRECMREAERSLNSLISSYLGKGVDRDYSKLSESAKQNFLRISTEAHAELRESPEERLKHLQWAASTFTRAALSYYIRVFHVDKRMRKQLERPQPKEEPVKEELSEATRIESIESLSQRDRFLVLIKLVDEKKHEDKEAREAFHKWSLPQLDEMWSNRLRKVILTQSERDQKKKQQALLSRPISEVPFNATERRLVEGLLAL